MTSLIDRLSGQAPLLILLASAAALGGALIGQYGFDLQPCVLCIYQRWPYVAAAAIALALWAVLRRRPALAAPVLVLAALAFATTAAIAGFHVGVEQHWWQGTTACGGAATPDSVEALRAMLKTAPVVRCDDVAWSLLGLSMAGWNLLYGAGLAIGCLVLARHRAVLS